MQKLDPGLQQIADIVAPAVLHLQSVSAKQCPGSSDAAGTHITPEVAPPGGLQPGIEVLHQLHTSPPQTLPPPPGQSLSTIQTVAPASLVPPPSAAASAGASPAASTRGLASVALSSPASVPASWASASEVQQRGPAALVANVTAITLHFMIVSLESKGLQAHGTTFLAAPLH